MRRLIFWSLEALKLHWSTQFSGTLNCSRNPQEPSDPTVSGGHEKATESREREPRYLYRPPGGSIDQGMEFFIRSNLADC